MVYNGLLGTFPKEIRLFIAIFTIVLSIGFFTGLLFVRQTEATTPDGVEQNYLGNENEELDVQIMKFEKGEREMLTIIHTHILSMSFIFFLLGGLVWLTKFKKNWKLFLTIEPFISVLLTFGGIYIMWTGIVWFKYIVIFSGILMTISFSFSALLVLYQNKILGEGLTYDDVLLVPAFSEVLPREVNIQTKFTRNITINVPIISAAMDTVTESRMAIAIAQEGGIGVLHKNMTIENQALKVRKVKRAESGMILDPVTMPLKSKVSDAKANMKEYSIGGIPIVDKNGKLIGIVTNRDLRFEKNNERPIEEVMTSKNLITAKEGTSLSEAEGILQEHKIEKLPVVDKNYKLVGLIKSLTLIKTNTDVYVLQRL